MDKIDWEQRMSDMAEYFRAKRDEITHEIFSTKDEVEYAQWVDLPTTEREDLELVSLLREVANRIERKYK